MKDAVTGSALPEPISLSGGQSSAFLPLPETDTHCSFEKPVYGIATKLAQIGARPQGAAYKDAPVLIRSGNDDPPLFLVDDGRGASAPSYTLAPYVGGEFPIVGLPLSREAITELPNMQAMASRMVRLIQEAQPFGPYRIAGWSFGGFLVYEMANQLLGIDEEVTFLGLYDLPHFALKPLAESRLEYQASLLPKEQSQEGTLARASIEYQLQPIHIPVHLFHQRDIVNLDALPGCLCATPDSLLRIIEVPGKAGSMLEEPTVAALGTLLAQAIQDTGRKGEPVFNNSYNPIVRIQGGHPGVLPIFCVPGAGASVMSFTDLVGALGPTWPVFGLQPRGLDGQQVPHASLEAAAACYTQAVIDANPSGPVHLLGHSFGGWIVFEMAHRLIQKGHKVASLSILDSEVPEGGGRQVVAHRQLEVMLKWINILELILDAPIGISCRELAAWSQAEQLNHIHDRLVVSGLMPKRSSSEILLGPLYTFAAALRASYSPKHVHPGRIFLALMDDPKLEASENEISRANTIEGWSRLAQKITSHHAAGNHMTGLKVPHSNKLSAWLFANALNTSNLAPP